MTNLVEILVTAKDLTGPAMGSVNAKVNAAGAGMAKFHKTAKLAGAGFALVGVEAVKMASKFDSEMALLNTQAGVSKDKVEGLKKGVLDLAGKVAQDPDSLAESLFHVESNFESMGISSKKALDIVKTSAEGATVGHADLVDVTNALTAAVASGIPGVQDMGQAMGTLNAIVGVGDMQMSDLAKAFGSGMVATVKGFGLSITDVGAGLAVFGDNNIRGANAATMLRLSVQALAKPVAGGEATLKSLGLQADSLAKDMQKGGLKLALEDLVAHMSAAGISSEQQGAIITDAFGRKAGAGLNILVGQMDRLESKYPALEKGAKGFGDSWAETQKTFAFQMKQLESSFQALMIGIGEKIIPPLQSFIHLLAQHKTATIDATIAMTGLLGAVVLVSAALKIAAGGKILWSGVTKGAALATGAMETAALKSMYMKDAFVTAGGGARGLSAAFGTIGTGTKMLGAIALVAGAALVFKHFSDEAKKAKVSSDEMSTGLKSLAAGSGSADLLGQLAKDADNLHQSLGQKLHSNDSIWDIVTNSGAKTSSAKKDYKELGSTLAEMVKNGDAKEAAASLKKINDSGKDIPTKYLKDYQLALKGTAAESELTAQSQGKFGKQAQTVQAALDVQAQSADALAKSLQALDQVNQDVYDAQTKFEDAIAKSSDALKDNGKTLDVHSEKGRNNRDALSAIASATDDYTGKLVKQKAGWDTVNAAYGRGYNALVKSAQGFGLSRAAAEKLADSLLHVPPEVKVSGNISDLEAKLKTAKSKLNSVPKSKKSALQANIADLEAKVLKAKWDLAQLGDKNITITTFMKSVYSGPQLGGAKRAGGGPVFGPGSGTSDDVPIMASNGEFVVNAQATTKHRGLLEAINSGMEGYASGGHVTKAQKAADERAKAKAKAAKDRAEARAKAAADAAQAEREARGEAAGGLGISGFGQMAGYQTSSFTRSAGAPDSLGDLVGTLNDWRSKIMAATHGATEAKLVKAFASFGQSMIKNEKALTAVNGKLDSARDKLASLKDSFAQLKDSISSSVVAYGSIAKNGTGQPGGPGSVISQMQGDVATAKRFAADIAALKKKGLNAQSLSEIAQAGIEGGGLETAERLLGSSKGDISEINNLEKQLAAAGAAAGTATADAMYGGGIKAADALVKQLAAQQAKLTAIWRDAANAMAQALKKALGIKGGNGTHIGAAAVGGPRSGATWVNEQGPELLDLPAGTMVHSASDSRRMASAGGGQMPPIQVVITLDGRVVAEQLLEPQRLMIQRKFGGDVQKAYGGRI